MLKSCWALLSVLLEMCPVVECGNGPPVYFLSLLWNTAWEKENKKTKKNPVNTAMETESSQFAEYYTDIFIERI